MSKELIYRNRNSNITNKNRTYSVYNDKESLEKTEIFQKVEN